MARARAAGWAARPEHRYRLIPEPMDEAAEWMAEVGSRWDRRLAELRKQFEE